MSNTHRLFTAGQQLRRRSWAEPWKIRMVEPIRQISREERLETIAEAGYNTFLVPAPKVYMDLLSDSGMAGMSNTQWAGIMDINNEGKVAGKERRHLESIIKDYYGYNFVIPIHHGHTTEEILCESLIRPGTWVPGNKYYATTRHIQEKSGGLYEDITISEANNPYFVHPFKGNIDIDKLVDFFERISLDTIAFVSVAATVNMIGGQPVSMENITLVHELCKARKIPLLLDASRVIDNAYFIQERELGYADHTISSIVKEFCAHTDGAWMHAKRSAFVHSGSVIMLHDNMLHEKILTVKKNRFPSQTQDIDLPDKECEAMAIGIEESMVDEQVRSRIGQVYYLGELLYNWGIPVVQPIGGHGVYIDAKKVYPHIPQEQFPAQMLTAQFYIDSGIRGMEWGIVSAGRDPTTGGNRLPAMELMRLAIPARVYTQAHIDVIAESIKTTYNNRTQVKGLRMIHEPKQLRFFQARFEPIS